MTFTKRLFIWAGPVIFTLACMVTSFPELLPSIAPATASPEPEIPVSTPTRFAFPTLTPPPTATPPYPTSPPVAPWIEEFANPILKALEGHRPDFHSDFASTLNQGWILINSTGRRAPENIHLQGDTLALRLPEGAERKDIAVSNRRLAYRNFVLSFDFKFGKTEPDDILRFQFRPARDQGVFLDISKNESWIYYWNLHNDSDFRTGLYQHYAPEWTNALIILRGEECAALLDQEPLDYIPNCRTGPIPKLSPFAVSLHVISSGQRMVEITGQPVQIIIDNIKVWDLDEVPGLP